MQSQFINESMEEQVYRSLSIEVVQSTPSSEYEPIQDHVHKANQIEFDFSSAMEKSQFLGPFKLQRCYTTDKFLSDDFLTRVPEAVYEANKYRRLVNVPMFIRN